MSSIDLLNRTIDEAISWMKAWSLIAFFETTHHTAWAELAPSLESFSTWRLEAAKTLQDQPALDRLSELHDQMHRLAKMAILKAPEGSAVTRNDYEAVAAKHEEFVAGLRRVERALAAAASGLDALTGLRSRAGMRDDLARELSRFQRSGTPFCLALADVDHFKKINDTYGHDGGDKVLAGVADHLSRSLRPFDDAWRWGGEEFLLCLKEADINAGLLALDRVRGGLEQMPIRLADGQLVFVTASFGLVAATKDANIDALLAKADRALYRAKESGRNKVEIAG